jgi:hypothetical protein
MTLINEPKIGNWYESNDSQSFKVVNIDHKEKTIEIQFLDGSHDDIDFEVWNSWEAESIVPPEDWEGLCKDDRGNVDNRHEDADEAFGDYTEIKEY